MKRINKELARLIEHFAYSLKTNNLRVAGYQGNVIIAQLLKNKKIHYFSTPFIEGERKIIGLQFRLDEGIIRYYIHIDNFLDGCFQYATVHESETECKIALHLLNELNIIKQNKLIPLF